MPTAYKLNDPINYPETLRNHKGVVTGNQYYRVRAGSVKDALFADGLPNIGSPWDSELTLVQLAKIDPRAEKPGGDWWVLTLSYETSSGFEHVPEDGLQIVTEINNVATTERVFFDLDGKKIGKDGQGTGKLLTATNYKIMTYSSQLPDLDALDSLSKPPTINDSPVVLRNLLGSGVNRGVDAEKLMYVNYQVRRVGDLYQVEHDVHHRNSWVFEQAKLTLAGESTGETETRRIHETADFVGAFAS